METPAKATPARTAAAMERQEADIKIMVYLVRENGLSKTIRNLQYALERIAAEILLPMQGHDTDTAAKFLKAVEELETPYEKIKNEIRL